MHMLLQDACECVCLSEGCETEVYSVQVVCSICIFMMLNW